MLDLRASFRFGWGKFLRYPSLTVVIFHGVDNGLNTNSYNQRISVLHRNVRFRSSPRADVLRGSSRVPAPLVGQERITNPKEQDIRPAKERLRVAWEATPDAIPNRTSKPFYFRSVSHLNLDNMTKFGKNRFEINHGKMGKCAWQQRTVTGVFLYFWLRKYLFMALKSI